MPGSVITFDPDALSREIDRLEGEMQKPGFWDDQDAAARTSAAHARAQGSVRGRQSGSHQRSSPIWSASVTERLK